MDGVIENSTRLHDADMASCLLTTTCEGVTFEIVERGPNRRAQAS